VFEERDLTDNVACTCDDTFSLVLLVSASLGIGFVPEWTQDLPNRGLELKKVRGVDSKIGLGEAFAAGKGGRLGGARGSRAYEHRIQGPAASTRSHARPRFI
jgi:DNA-binding transcriptional LysR family regulator